jgi:hypothetical protein
VQDILDIIRHLNWYPRIIGAHKCGNLLKIMLDLVIFVSILNDMPPAAWTFATTTYT